MPQKSTTTQPILDEALRLGFMLSGITTPGTPPHINSYEKWLELGRHGDMGYLSIPQARILRANPTLVFPETRSILVLGMPYPSPSSIPLPGDGHLHGRIAAYAWGDDYHLIVPVRLKILADFITKQFGNESLSHGFTDTAPILERDLAQRASLGWIGKNTCLIDPHHGSYFLLAELFLSLDLEPDPPFIHDRCGTCKRCIQACPTRCILPDRTLDAGRCISYLTIEKKGPISRDLRPMMGDWVFGCDICQAVCPWNKRFGGLPGDLAFAPRPDVPFPDLGKELALSVHEFNQKFRHSPVQRPHRRGYLRNVAIALGNSKSSEALPALEQALLTEPEALVRGAAAWALHQIDTPAAHLALSKAERGESDPAVLDEINAT